MKDIATRPPADLVHALNSWDRFVCVGHVIPDADCLGAMLGAARAFSDDGARRVTVALPEGSVSRKLAFMTDLADVAIARDEDYAAAEGFLVVDVARKSRCNLPAQFAGTWPAGRPVVCVDHHVSNTRFGDINWVVGGAASTCELIVAVLKQAGVHVDAATASLLYAGILTDTAGFSLNTTSGHTLRAAGELVDLGADVGMVGERIERSLDVSAFRLLKTLYANTRLTAGDKIAYSTASYEEITAEGLSAVDIDDQIAVPRLLGGTRLAILFTEGEQGRTRMNFRGKSGFSVMELAKRFGGGGHIEAAGAILDCGIDEAVARVLPIAVDMVTGPGDAGAGARSEVSREVG